MHPTDTWTPPPDYSHLEYFKRLRIGPPGALYVTLDDTLALTWWTPTGSQTLTVTLRWLSPDGQIIPELFTFTTGAADIAVRKNLTPAEGFLLSATITGSGAAPRSAFARLHILRGVGSSDVAQGHLLAAGYVGGVDMIAFPQTPAASSLEGRGQMRSIGIANPAAATDFSIVVPAGVHWILRGVRCLLTTDATAPVRVPSLVVQDGALNSVLKAPIFSTIAASSVATISWFNSATNSSQLTSEAGGIPAEFRAPTGWTIRSSTAAFGPADQYSGVFLAVEEFVGT